MDVCVDLGVDFSANCHRRVGLINDSLDSFKLFALSISLALELTEQILVSHFLCFGQSLPVSTLMGLNLGFTLLKDYLEVFEVFDEVGIVPVRKGI